MAKIVKLSPETITKIAAGEVVCSGKAAVKELVENSIDASSDKIGVILRGNKNLESIEISDNGKGVHPSDFPLLCEKHATSKIETFEDLKAIGSMGFRGEALASISFVAKVHVMSSQSENGIGYEAQFANGCIVETRSKSITVCCHRKGTTVKVTDFFYNLDSRRKECLLESESRKISKFLSKMALHYSNIEFTFSSFHSGNKDQRKSISIKKSQIISQGKEKSDSQIKAALIYRLFAKTIDSEEDLIEYSQPMKSQGVEINGLFLKPNSKFSGKKAIIFINDRLVKHRQLKSAIERAYNEIMVGIYGSKVSYFVYLSVNVNKQLIDVNVHPNKRMVQFHGEEEVGKLFHEKLIEFLKESVNVKQFKPVGMYQKAFVIKENEGGMGGNSQVSLGVASQENRVQNSQSSSGVWENKRQFGGSQINGVSRIGSEAEKDLVPKRKLKGSSDVFSDEILNDEERKGVKMSPFEFESSGHGSFSRNGTGKCSTKSTWPNLATPNTASSTANNTRLNTVGPSGSWARNGLSQSQSQYTTKQVRKDPKEQKLEQFFTKGPQIPSSQTISNEMSPTTRSILEELITECNSLGHEMDSLEFIRQGTFIGSIHPLIVFVQYSKHLIRLDLLEAMRDFFYFYSLKTTPKNLRTKVFNEPINVLPFLNGNSLKIAPFLQKNCTKTLSGFMGFNFSMSEKEFSIIEVPQPFEEISLTQKQWSDFLIRVAVNFKRILQIDSVPNTKDPVQMAGDIKESECGSVYSVEAMILEKYPPLLDPNLFEKLEETQKYSKKASNGLIGTGDHQITAMTIEKNGKSSEKPIDDSLELDKNQEKRLIRALCHELADALVLSLNQEYPEVDMKRFKEQKDDEKFKRLYEQQVFPLIKKWNFRSQLPFEGFAESILDLDKIYSIFERC